MLAGAQLPRVSLRPKPHSLRDAEDAIAFSCSYGLQPDPWQAWTIQGWLARKSNGKLASARCGLAVPRQNGKNGALEIVELFKMVILGRKILHTAHEVKTARKAFVRLASFFENERQYPELAAMVKEIRRTNGQEAIVLTNGASCEFIARSKGSGRGFTVDDLVCDEAQELSEDALAALLPTISAAPSGDPQLIFTGTPPAMNMNGEAFTRMRLAGLLGKDARLCWDEWSCEGMSVDLDDIANVAAANPALGGRLSLEVIRDERESFDDQTFARERLGMWDGVAAFAVIDPLEWKAHGEAGSQVLDPVAIAVDVAPMNVTASLGIAGLREDGRAHVEVVKNQRGTGWVVDALVKMNESKPCVIVLDPASGAGALLPAIEAAGLTVYKVSAREMAQACVGFHQAFTEGDAVHIEQPLLTAALGGASKRDLAGLFAWTRRDSNTDITPLVAVTLALWAFAHSAAQPKPKAPSAVYAF